MPYIEKGDRSRALSEPRTPGELNFAITHLLDWYIARKGLNYTFINDAIGALESAKMEFYRRVAVPYEDEKIRSNGDVYAAAHVPPSRFEKELTRIEQKASRR